MLQVMSDTLLQLYTAAEVGHCIKIRLYGRMPWWWIVPFTFVWPCVSHVIFKKRHSCR